MSTRSPNQFDQLHLSGTSPITPRTKLFIDSCLSNFEITMNGGVDGLYQNGEQDCQEFEIDNFINGGQSFSEMLEGSELPENQQLQIPAGQVEDMRLQKINFDDLQLDIDHTMINPGEYLQIPFDDSHIDPELRMFDEPIGTIGITPPKLQTDTSSTLTFPKKTSAIYDSITVSSVPKDGFQKSPTLFGSSPIYVKTVVHPVAATDYFLSTSPVPRIRINGSYTITHAKSGTSFSYTSYSSLPLWHAPGLPSSGITYNSLGFLDKTIFFTGETLTSFLRHHPLGPSLILRIEKHPYEAKNRYISASVSHSNRGKNKKDSKPKYTSCRAKNCVLGGIIKMNEYRVAIDEISGRFKESDERDNDPHFASCFLHLQCFESLTNIAPIIATGVLIPDDRDNFPKEPAAGKNLKNNNKMGLCNKELAAFRTWKANSNPGQSQAQGRDTLYAALWLSNVKKSRPNCLHRAPPGVTQEDIDKQMATRALWGGRRATGITVSEMYKLEQEGRCDLLIAPRNGISKKMGMGASGATSMRFQGKKRAEKLGKPIKLTKLDGRKRKWDADEKDEASSLYSSPDLKRKVVMEQSPPQKKSRGLPNDMRIQVLSSPPASERLPLSPMLGYSPSLATFDLLTSVPITPLRRSARGKGDTFSWSPLTPTRRSPRSVTFVPPPATPTRRSLRKNSLSLTMTPTRRTPGTAGLDFALITPTRSSSRKNSHSLQMTPTRRSPRNSGKKVNYAESNWQKENVHYGDNNEELFGLDLDMDFDEYMQFD